MPEIDQPTTPTPKSATANRKPKPTPETRKQAAAGLFAFTIDAGKGRIVTIEKVEGEGTRKPLTSQERTELAKAYDGMPLRRAVEQAFEAGIACVLGEHEPGENPESSEDRELSSILLQTLIEGSAAKDLMKGETLNRMIVGTLFRNAAKSADPVNQ